MALHPTTIERCPLCGNECQIASPLPSPRHWRDQRMLPPKIRVECRRCDYRTADFPTPGDAIAAHNAEVERCWRSDDMTFPE